MQSTRQAILDYLRVHREGSVRDLSRKLMLTTTGIRQHLAVLEEAGYVAYRDVKGRVGRPALIYRLTDDAEALYPKSYDRLAIAMLQSVQEVCEGDLQERMIEAVGGYLSATFPDASSGSLATRAAIVADHLRSGGDIVTVDETDGHVSIVQHTCPFQGAADAAPSVCAMDIERLRQATGCHVELTETRTRGASDCVFQLSLPSAN